MGGKAVESWILADLSYCTKLYENKTNKSSHGKQESEASLFGFFGAAPESTPHSLLRASNSVHKASLSMPIILA